MKYKVYEIVSEHDFYNNDRPSMRISFNTEEHGLLEVTVYKNRFYSVCCKEKFLPIGLNGKNPYFRDDMAAYIKDGKIYLGFKYEN